MSSIMRCRSGLMALSVMRDAPVFGEGCEPLISRQDAPWRYRVGCVVRRGALPRERFSPLALFGPDRPGWRRLFLRVKRTAQLLTQTSEFDPGCAKTQKVETRRE